MFSKKFICVRQQDITDCGAACLASIAWYYDLKIPISRIREYAKTDRRGTNVLGMLQAAEALGFTAKGVKGDQEALYEIPFPTIAHIILENGLHHYVVICKSTKKHFTIADPAKGLCKVKRDDFIKTWSGVLILISPNYGFKTGNLKESNFERFVNLIKPHPGLLIESIISALVNTILGLATAFYVGHLVDSVFPDSNQRLLNVLSAAMIAIMVFRVFFGSTRQVLLLYLSQKIDVSLILGYYKHILKLPQTFFDSRRVGEIISRMNDAVKIRTAISSASLTIIIDSSTLVFSFGLMFIYSWKLALISSVVIPIFLLLFLVMRKPIQRTQLEIMEKAADMQSHLVSSINGIATIKAFQAERMNNEKTEVTFVQTLRLIWRSGMQGLIYSIGNDTVSGFLLLAVFWTGGTYVVDREMTVGELMSFYSLIGYFSGSVGRLIGINQTIQDALIATDRLFEILDLETEEKIHRGKFPLQRTGLDKIRFDHVSFQYGTRAHILKDVTFDIPISQMTAIVGESGSGKTTVAKLLQGFYPLIDGDIFFENISIKHIRLDELRSFCGVVPQEIELFHGTVIDNIIFGDSQPDMNKVIQASNLSGAGQFIKNLPYAWDTLLGERGMNLSGGERQRLALARALYRDPKLLILDEATSSLDSESEYIIQEALHGLRQKGMTILVIAHRLSTVMNADQIIVLDKGEVIERGNHVELMDNMGKYSSLWKRQSPVMSAV